MNLTSLAAQFQLFCSEKFKPQMLENHVRFPLLQAYRVESLEILTEGTLVKVNYF